MVKSIRHLLTLLFLTVAAVGASAQKVVNVAVIPVQFEDVKFTVEDPQAEVRDLFTGSSVFRPDITGSVANYFSDNFGYGTSFNFHTTPVLTLDKPLKYYGENTSGVIDLHLLAMLEHALQEADVQQVTLPFPSGSHIDCCYVIFAGHAETEEANHDSIWPQSVDIRQFGFSFCGLLVNWFSCSSIYSGADGDTITPIGPICHELGHTLGLVDMYDANGQTEGESKGLWGTTSLMDRGAFNNGGVTPPYLNVVEREMLGLVEVEDIMPYQSYILSPINFANKAYRIPTGVEGEYFLLECRTPSKWDLYIGGEGLVIYHVDRSGNKAGTMTAAQRWQYNAVNCCCDHPCAGIVSAAGHNTEEARDIFFPGPHNVTDVNSGSDDPLLSWNGEGPGISLRNIYYTLGIVHFETDVDILWKFPNVEHCTEEPFQTECRIKWSPSSQKRGKWIFEWWMPDDPTHVHTITDCGTELTLENLFPDEIYNYRILFDATGNQDPEPLVREVYSSMFATYSHNSEYPRIWMPSGNFNVGETLDLKVFNTPADCSGIEWKVNRKSLFSKAYTFTEAGKCTISAILSYQDGSVETIERTIIIGEK